MRKVKMIRMHRHLTVMRQALKADKTLALFESLFRGEAERWME